MKQFFILLFSIVLGYSSSAQNHETLSIIDFLSWVDEHHPLLKSVKNKLPIAKAEAWGARGSFDPTLIGNYASKEFDNELYYRLPSWSIQTQTRGPVSLHMDWNQTVGIYTNPQDKLPEQGLFALGGMIQLGNGLLTDQRRIDLSLALSDVDLTEAEAELYRNEILFKASTSYWNWYAAHESLEAYRDALEAASQVYKFTQKAFEVGDASAMDTLDAQSLLTTWQAEYYDARKVAVESLYAVSNWLWNENNQPVILNATTKPSIEKLPMTDQAIISLDHPLVRYNDQKEKQLKLKINLASEYLKPKVAIGGAFLVAGNASDIPETADFNTGDRVLKAKVEMPLLLREGRGYNKSTKLQLQSFEWEREAQENILKNALSATAASILLLEEAVKVSVRNESATAALLRAEQRKLELGDSELIKVNLRTNYFLKAVVQRVKLTAELGTKQAEFMQLNASF